MMSERIKSVLRFLLAGIMVFIGVGHFVKPEPFVVIVPDFLPAKLALVYVSGVFEILGGVGLLVPLTRQWAGLGLIALFLAVFPANINQAMHAIQFDPLHPAPEWVFWLRLPFQVLLIWLAWWTSRPQKTA